MIIPWGTDAPIYHRPVATITLIVLNVLSALLLPPGLYEDWTLVLGEGVHPVQWVTNIFMHLGFGHLIGNMLFLWAFGIIVEGKLGWRAFALVYLGLGIVESALMQVLIHPDEPVHMLGASGVVFGLLAMCLVWAPRNELQCIFLFRIIPVEFDFPILSVAAFYIGMEVLFLALKRMAISSELAHCSGAIMGFGLAVLMLKFHFVDCENWDLFAVLEGRQGQSKKEARKAKAARRLVSVEFAPPARAKKKRSAKGKAPQVRSLEDPSAAALRALRLHIELGEVEAAVAVYKKSSRSLPGWQPRESDWIDLIEAILKQHDWNEAVLVMRDYFRKTAEPSPRVGLKLAQILIQKLERPMHGLKALELVPEASLPDSLVMTRRQLTQQAEQMLEDEDGTLELQDEMW
jgi:membrane associated rhomboid family serine protease